MEHGLSKLMLFSSFQKNLKIILSSAEKQPQNLKEGQNLGTFPNLEFWQIMGLTMTFKKAFSWAHSYKKGLQVSFTLFPFYTPMDLPSSLVEILYRILQDFLGSYEILQDPVSSHRILPRIPNGNNPNHVL